MRAVHCQGMVLSQIASQAAIQLSIVPLDANRPAVRIASQLTTAQQCQGRVLTGRPGPLPPLFHCACCTAAILVAKVAVAAAAGRTAPRMPLAGTPSNGFGPYTQKPAGSVPGCD